MLAVEDDGPGIPAELQDKVFERFFRGAGDRGGSSGLGLSIVRAVTESHDGTVALEPPLDGRGARFVVRLPARPARHPEGPEGPDHRRSSPAADAAHRAGLHLNMGFEAGGAVEVLGVVGDDDALPVREAPGMARPRVGKALT